MGTITVVTSGKGGAGKSTVSAGLGCALADLGHKVLLLDGDAGLRSLDLMLGVSSATVYDMADVFAGRCEPVRAYRGGGLPPHADAPHGDAPLAQRLCAGRVGQILLGSAQQLRLHAQALQLDTRFRPSKPRPWRERPLYAGYRQPSPHCCGPRLPSPPRCGKAVR